MKLRQVLSAGQPYGYEHHCPGCKSSHIFVVEGRHPGGGWDFSRNMERPSFRPSMRVFVPARKDADGKVLKPERTLCHYHLVKGRIRFLNDCEHELKGKTVDLPDLPAEPAS